MGKQSYIARGREDKEFMMGAEEELLEDPLSEDEDSPSLVIRLAESRHPRRVPPRASSANKSTTAQSAGPVVDATPVADADAVSKAKGPSRKERKRMAARERARHVKTLADTIVDEGRVVDESEYVADPALAFPIAGLPLDIVRDVLLFYINVPSIVNAMAASSGFRMMLADDLLWRDVFRTQSLESLDRRLWKRVRNRAKTWSQKAMLMTRVVTTSPEEQRALKLRALRRQEMQQTKESAELRMMLKQRTEEWDEIEEIFYVHCVTRHVSMSHTRPKKPLKLNSAYSKMPHVFYIPDYDYNKEYVRKSIACPVQYRCPHARVGYCKDKHQVVCLDCNVCTHTVTVPDNVYVF